MNRRRVLVLGAILGAVAVTIVFGVRGPREPAYQGKALSRLLEDVASSKSDLDAGESAATGIRQLGTNCIPVLLTLLQQREHPLTTKTKWLIERYGPDWVRFSDPGEQRVRGMYGFVVLGPLARSATPALSNLVQQPDIAWQVAWALGALGEGGVEALVLTLTNSHKRVRLASICALGHWRTNTVAANALTRLLEDKDYEIRAATAEAVGHLDEAAPVVVPALVKGMADTNADFRSRCAWSLGWIGPQAREAVPALLAAPTNNDGHFAASVRYALFHICSNSVGRTESK
jgi:HEAT repeat protein